LRPELLNAFLFLFSVLWQEESFMGRRLRSCLVPLGLLALFLGQPLKANTPLGLPPLEVPADNPITKDKVALGERLYHDIRFSATGTVACATCHASNTGFTDSPLKVSKGINDLTGTRNSPTVTNAAYNQTQFWDGRSPTLEDQALHPFINPVEMGLKDHQPILQVIAKDKSYGDAFKKVFGVSGDKVTMDHVTKAIAAFERTLIFGNSRFDRWYYKGEKTLNAKEIAGFEVYVGNGRCVSCHVIEHSTALFTDHKFHNVGVGINTVPQADIDRLALEYLQAQYKAEDVDVKALQDVKSSELGRFAVTRKLSEVGAFKTPTLRNIELTAPYMHDGSLKTLEDVVEHYNRGGASSDKETINPYLSGGIRPLDLTAAEKEALVAFLKTLTSKELAR
jgi:cytochrome c peroxidase